MRRPRAFLLTITVIFVLASCLAGQTREQQSSEKRAEEILEATGVTGGLVVHVGSGDGLLTAALRARDGILVQGLDTNEDDVTMARRHVQSLGLYGPVTVDAFDGEYLPYAENLVNLLVVSAS